MAKLLKVAFLGGVGEIGKNMTVIEYGDNMILIDCGSMFPNNETPGVDLIIPDFSYVQENASKIRAILLTHGHEDHIGAMPFLLKTIPDVKVYGTKLTLTLLEHKVQEARIKMPKTQIVEGGDVERIGCFSVEFVRQSHSISGALALAISTPMGVLFHTGDYKFDFTPVKGASADMSQIARIGAEGVLLMMGESTNIEKPGVSMSESAVGGTFDKLFSTYINNRIIIATFASNVHRVQQIISTCEKYGRKVVFNGRSMKNISEMAMKIGELSFNKNTVIDIEEMSKHHPKKICIISTGSQGEPMSALTRMAAGDDRITVGVNDVVILSSSPIPGNEKYVYNTINNLYRRGAKVIYGSLNELHVSGHACEEELKLMLSLIRPKLFIPVHGEYRHLKQHEELAEKLGVSPKNIEVPDIGSQYEIRKNKIVPLKNVAAGNVFVDGLTDVDNMILRDRTQLAQDGFVAILINISLEDSTLSAPVEFIARGLSFNDEVVGEMREIVQSIVERFDYNNAEDRNNFKIKVRRQIGNFIYKNMKQRPMLLPIVMEI